MLHCGANVDKNLRPSYIRKVPLQPAEPTEWNATRVGESREDARKDSRRRTGSL